MVDAYPCDARLEVELVSELVVEGFECRLEPEAGVHLTGEQAGERWWGTRVRYRRPPARRWESFVLVDVHPMDVETTSAAIRLALARSST